MSEPLDPNDPFERELTASWLKRKVRLDTSDLTPDAVLPAFLAAVRRHLGPRDLLMLGD